MDNLVRFKARKIVDGVPEKEAKVVYFSPRFVVNVTALENKSSEVTLMDGKRYVVGITPRAFKIKLSAWGNAHWSAGGSNN